MRYRRNLRRSSWLMVRIKKMLDICISNIAKAKNTSSPSVMAEFGRRPSSYMRAVRMLAFSKMSRSPAAPYSQRS